MQDFVDELIRREEFDGTVIFQQVRTFLTRVAAILIEIDANDLNNVFASRHFIMSKIGDFLGCSEVLNTLSRLLLLTPNVARSAKLIFCCRRRHRPF